MSIYSKVPIKKPGRNAFNLSHTFRGTLNIGELKPICRPLECVPGDTFITGNISKLDMSPIITNFFGELYFETWQFFVSNDMLYQSGDSGKFTEILASLQDPQNLLSLPYISTSGDNSNCHDKIMAYLYGDIFEHNSISTSKHILAYPARAVVKIFNEWFRDENLQEEVSSLAPSTVLNVNYKKDRFTSAFLSTQKGTEIKFTFPTTALLKVKTLTELQHTYLENYDYNDPTLDFGLLPNRDGNTTLSNPFYYAYPSTSPNHELSNDEIELFNKRIDDKIIQRYYVDLSAVKGISINDLRLYNKLQKWQERNQLCGTRLKEYLLANYGVTPNDETLQRPVLIGHTKVPVIIDPIIANIQQNNVSDSGSTLEKLQNLQGSRGGVAGTSSSFKYGKWFCKEFGWIITLGALRPKASYFQGIHKSLRKDNIVDFFNPIFQHLGQQEIKKSEIYFTNTSSTDDPDENDDTILGFQDIYNEMRHLEDFTAPDLAHKFENYTMFRKFSSAPTLSDSFIQVKASEYDYLFALPHTTAPHCMFTSNNIIKAIRPIAKRSTPSL